MGVNKITIDGVTKINLLNTDIESPADIPTGKRGYLKTGELVTGTGGNMSNPLTGKILAVTGDSICAGEGYTGGYAKIIGDDNGMTVQNIGVGGGTVVNSSGRFCISTSIADLRADADYVILEGGANDAWNVITEGTITSGFSDALNTGTFAGAFETMLKSAINRFPTAKIGYIFIHKWASQWDNRNANGNYYGIAKAACEKWGIPYCDLNTETPPIGYISALASAYTANGDGMHPTEQGYRLFYVPKITAWMKTL